MPSIISTLNDHCLQWIGTIATEDALHALSLTCSHLRSLYADEKTKRKHVPTEWYYLYHVSQTKFCPKEIQILSIDSDIQRIRYKVTWRISGKNTSSAIISEHQTIDHPFLLPYVKKGILSSPPLYHKSDLELYAFETNELVQRVVHFMKPLNLSKVVKEEICNYVTALRDKLRTTTMSYMSLVMHEENAWETKCVSWQLKQRLTIDQRLYIRNLFFKIVWNPFKAHYTSLTYNRSTDSIGDYYIELADTDTLQEKVWIRNGAKVLRDEGDDNVIQYELASSDTIYITKRDREETTTIEDNTYYPMNIDDDDDKLGLNYIANAGSGLRVKCVDEHIVVEDTSLKTTCNLPNVIAKHPSCTRAFNAKQDGDSLILVLLQHSYEIDSETLDWCNEKSWFVYCKYERDTNTNKMKYKQVEQTVCPVNIDNAGLGNPVVAYYNGHVYCKLDEEQFVKLNVKKGQLVEKPWSAVTSYLYQLEDGICYLEQNFRAHMDDFPEYYDLVFYLERGAVQIRKEICLGVNYAVWIEYKGRNDHGKDEFYVHSYTNNMVRGHLHKRKFCVTKVLV